jgi:hypothetical protein
VSIETKAREAEGKCTDLIERINYMVGHLAELQTVKVTQTLESVLERMNKILKDSGALIQTFRKQGKIARRLNMGMKAQFEGKFSAIEKTTADLMFSLQIHQTQKLQEISNKITVDPLDKQAESFVASHGGLDNIKVAFQTNI